MTLTRDSGYDAWNVPTSTHVITRTTQSGRSKAKDLLARHGELEQSENKAQGALVTILTLTQITELKLLLDLGQTGHRFYEFVMTMLIACICLELFVGIIIIYIGNLHYYSFGGGRSICASSCYRFLLCMTCCCRSCRAQLKRHGAYQSVKDTTPGSAAGVEAVQVRRGLRLTARSPSSLESRVTEEEVADESSGVGSGRGLGRVGGGAWRVGADNMLSAEDRFQIAHIRAADAEHKMAHFRNLVYALEAAAPRPQPRSQAAASSAQRPSSPPAVDARQAEELIRAREGLQAATRLRQEAEVDMREAEVVVSRALVEKELREEMKEEDTFRTLSLWQHAATYLLWFIMLMNVFITTFGISGGSHNVFSGSGGHGAAPDVAIPVNSTGNLPAA